MPFKSKAQERWMWATHPEMAKRWAAHTPAGERLPERVKNRQARNARLRAGLPPSSKKSPLELAAGPPALRVFPVPFARDQTSYPPYTQIGGSPVSGMPDGSQQPPAEPWPNGVVLETLSQDSPTIGPPDRLRIGPSNPGPGGPVMEMSQQPIKFTKTEQKVLALLGDGLPHPQKEVYLLFENPHMSMSTMWSHLSNIKQKLRLIGQDIICGSVGRRKFYQQVRLLIRRD